MPRFRPALIALLILGWANAQSIAADFPLVQAGRAAPLVVAPEDHEVVRLAAADLARDIAAVTGVTPSVGPRAASGAPRVLIGTLGHSPLIDRLTDAGQLDVSALRGAWESFIIAVLPPARPEADPLLVIAGSDRRGTAFGIYELAQQIGVSPWHWWADVPPEKQPELLIPAGTRRFGPPSVKYRGIFLNDEDWGLQPWAATTFEPENGGIGPKTYAKVFELLLRLKANTLWPAMHACTQPFNADPRNAALADRYAIVMGSSHAEPMLRNNVGEWPHDRPKDYNYIANREGVRAYWEERVRTNAAYESIWTLGMRGIHDSAIQGANTDGERINVLEQVFADQRDLLTQHVGPALSQSSLWGLVPGRPPTAPSPALAAIPQMFCAYKEVLDLYRQGLRVPDDVTIVWPDDNFGYVRSFASSKDRQRSGGFGVYYHLSYLGRPLAYLWLNTTPPALIWSEMTKSYAHGADRIWIVNVGDLKPAEIGTEFFLNLAWDVKTWGPDAQPAFLRKWAAREFGPAHANEIAAVMSDFYTLNFARKPEHLQWWLPRQDPRQSDFTDAEIAARLDAFASLRTRTDVLAAALPAAKQDAFFQLVAYPVHGAALANARYFLGERGDLDAARAADAELHALTRRFNEDIAGGKWRGFIRLEPADDDWKSMRIAAWAPPAFAPRRPYDPPPPVATIPASRFAQHTGGGHVVAGLGRSGAAVTIDSTTRLRYEFTVDRPGDYEVRLHLLPTHRVGQAFPRLALAIDQQPTEAVIEPIDDGGPQWTQGVLRNERIARVAITLTAAGAHSLRLYGDDEGAVLDRIEIHPRP